jgi:hypothetical protein
MIPAAMASIEAGDIDRLVTSGRSEARDLEFKRELPGGSDTEIKEFLADVTSLANAQGGDLIFGIEDVGGVASAVPGLQLDDVDSSILRLENICRDGVEPRINGIKTRWIERSDGGVMVMRMPASLAAPHRIKFKNSGRFYARNSRGKYEMDTHELRHAFTENAGLPARFSSLHDSAIIASTGDSMPFALKREPRAIVTIAPITLFREARSLDVTPEKAVMPVKPAGSISWMHTLEGALVYITPGQADGSVRSYALTNRQGYVDAAWTIGGERELANGQSATLVWPEKFEEGLIDMTTAATTWLSNYGIEGPWIVMATIAGVTSSQLVTGNHSASREAWRDGARMQDLIVEQVSRDALLPLFRSLWLLFGTRPPY